MGVTKLWEVLKDVKADVNLETIKGQTLAVDLATWICESEGVKPMKGHVSRPYLRNLFFRVSAVLKARINLVFVLDGKAPELKLQTIAKRLGSSGDNPKKTSGVRARLNAKLKECCVLLDSLGVPWIKAESEAEALCAHLNKMGYVDAVVTNDGDAFLYGARTVYRNFSVEKNVLIERYAMRDIERGLSLRQRDLIALGLLLGCDYCPKGVTGIGVSQAAKLLSSFCGKDALAVFTNWRETGRNFNASECAKKVSHCSACGHEGTRKTHHETGCGTCGNSCSSGIKMTKRDAHSIPCKCQWHREEEKRKICTLEEKIKTSALKDPKFPDQNIIFEFLKAQNYVKPGTVGVNNLPDPSLVGRFETKAPTLDTACRYLQQKLEWELPYAVSKVLPLATHYLLNSSDGSVKSEDGVRQIWIHSILRTRVKDRVSSLEVKWSVQSNMLADSSTDNDLVTLEPEDVVEKKFPQLVSEFYRRTEKEKELKKKEKAGARKAERKKEKGSSSSQTAKLTDFFKVKKIKTDDRTVDVRTDSKASPSSKIDSNEETGLNSLEVQLKCMSIDEVTENEPTSAPRQDKQNNKKPLQPVMIFSSDSEDSDLENIECRLGELAIRGITKDPALKNYDGKIPGQPSPQNNDITFENELDFSLGCSLLHTPNQKLSDAFPVEKMHSRKAGEEELPLNEVEINKRIVLEELGTPVKTSVVHSAGVTDSPVFMTLMERLKARKGSLL